VAIKEFSVNAQGSRIVRSCVDGALQTFASLSGLAFRFELPRFCA
jgi:hypothetical protein